MPRQKNLTTSDPAAPRESLASGSRDQSERVPETGEVIAGKYRIEGLLGRGGMGVVARGRQLELDRAVAIKFLRPALALDARPLQRFAREARIIAQMGSEHVVRVFDVGREKGVPFIVMEHLSGHDLAKEIAGGALSVERAVEFALHACEALGEAHSLGIVHRDVKPSNLFVAERFGGRESLKVLDFGVSKWLLSAADHDTPQVTTEGGAVGTPAFASPEQLTRPETIDGRTDIWALGVVLYQALSGALPFKADTIPALYSQIISGEPTPFPSDQGVPPGLVAVLTRCLERDPKDRYQSMLELARALVPFAPARAHGIVESLATLAHQSSARATSGLNEPVVSSLSTTLEFSQVTPDASAAGTPERAPRRSQGRWLGGLLVLGGIGVLLLLALREQGPVRGSSPATAAPSLVTATPERSVAAAPGTVSPPLPVAPPSPRAAPTASTTPVASTSSVAPAATGARAVKPKARPKATAVAPAPSATPAASPSAPRRSDAIPLYRH